LLGLGADQEFKSKETIQPSAGVSLYHVDKHQSRSVAKALVVLKLCQDAVPDLSNVLGIKIFAALFASPQRLLGAAWLEVLEALF
jgi:hypothetical protein